MPEQKITELMQAGIQAVKQGEKSQARVLFLEVTELHPKHETVWLWLAQITEIPRLKITYLRRAFHITPDHKPVRDSFRTALMQEGVHLAKTGNKTEAFGFFAEITGFDETFEPAWLWLASLAEEPAATRDYLKRVLTLNPANQNAKSWLERLPRESAPQPAAVVAVVPPAASAPVSAPTTPVALPTVEPALPPETPPAFPVRHKGLVLTIDDSSIIRQAVVLTLEKEGFKVLEAENGMEALTILNDIVPDLILLDINMPMMDGYEVCKVIRKSQHARHVPVVMLSGKDGFFDKVKGKMAGSTEYLTKPFNPEQLRKTVEKHVQAAKPEEVIPGRSVFRLV